MPPIFSTFNSTMRCLIILGYVVYSYFQFYNEMPHNIKICCVLIICENFQHNLQIRFGNWFEVSELRFTLVVLGFTLVVLGFTLVIFRFTLVIFKSKLFIFNFDFKKLKY